MRTKLEEKNQTAHQTDEAKAKIIENKSVVYQLF